LVIWLSSPSGPEQFHALRLGRREQFVGHRRMNQRFPAGSIRSPWQSLSLDAPRELV